MRTCLVCASLLFATLILSGPVFAAAAAPRWEAVQTKQPPVIDGDLGDACWAEQTQVDNFRDPLSGEPAKAQTYFRALYDQDALYLAVLCREPDMNGLRANLRGHDDDLWTDDCVEVMLDPTNQRQSYAHLIVNPNGALYDAWVADGGADVDLDYESGAQVAARRNADSWQVEMRIPFSGLRLARDARPEWGFQVCRERKAGGGELSCWSPPGAEGFHHPAAFGTLSFPRLNLRPHMVSWGTPRLEEPYFEGGKLAGNLVVPTDNATGHGIGTKVRAVFVGEGDQRTETVGYSNVPEGKRQMVLPVVVGKPGFVKLELDIWRRKPEKLLQHAHSALRLDLQPVSIEFLKPAYRDAIYASVSDPAIVCSIQVNVPRKQYPACNLRATFNSGVTELSVRHVARLSRTGGAQVEFTSETVPAGDYVVKVQALDKAGQVLAEGQRPLRKFRPQPHEVVLDNEGRLRVDGRAFFPWGFMGADPDPVLSRLGFNTVHNYNTWYIHRDKNLTAWLDEARKLGLHVVMSPFPGPLTANGFRDKPELSEADLQDIRAYVDQYKSHPALLAWYMCDEPRGSLWRMNLQKAYRVVAEADPFHPCVALDDSPAALAGLDRVGDILWIDPYPRFAAGGAPRQPLTMVPAAVAGVRAAVRRPRPVWVAPQAFSYADGNKPLEDTERAPSFREIRAMHYLALLGGADGIVPFAWTYAQRHPSIHDAYVEGLGPEMGLLMPVLLNGRVIARTKAEARSPHAEVQMRAWLHEGSFYVIAVNTRPEPAKAWLHVPALGSRRLRVLAERRFVQSQDDGLEDSFGPYGVHLYSDHHKLPSLPDLEQIERHIANDEAARKATW